MEEVKRKERMEGGSKKDDEVKGKRKLRKKKRSRIKVSRTGEWRRKQMCRGRRGKREDKEGASREEDKVERKRKGMNRSRKDKEGK